MKQLIVAIAVIFDHNKKVLLTQRYSPDVLTWHNKWQLPGGKVKQKEKITDAAIREAKEEVGIEIELLTDIPLEYVNEYPQESIIAKLLCFPAIHKNGTVNIKNDAETKDARWYDFNQIHQLDCLPNTKEIIIHAQKFINHKS